MTSPGLLCRRRRHHHRSLDVSVEVSPHLRLLIGQVVAGAAVQREGVALPLAVLAHVALEKASPIRLEPAHVTPGGAGGRETLIKCECSEPARLFFALMLPVEVGATRGLIPAGLCEGENNHGA